MTEVWLQANARAAWAWYYRGASLRSLGRSGALPALEQAVAIDARIAAARLGLCIALYHADRTRDSLTCAEHLEHSDREAYVARTFRHPVHVHGLVRAPGPAQARISIVPD